jgi:hypothetical protein
MPWSQRAPRGLALLAWMAVISYWSHQSSLPIDEPTVANLLGGFQHRLAHLVAFGILGLLARWAVDDLPRPGALAVLIVAVFSALDEWHQSFIPGRLARVDDWLFDIASASIFLLLLPRVRRIHWSPRVLAPLVLAIAFALAALAQRQLV